jgi:hypothetical protein
MAVGRGIRQTAANPRLLSERGARNRAVHFFGVSDIIEPQAWREYKKQLTGNEWDYDFRRLFTPDNRHHERRLSRMDRDCEPGQDLRLGLAVRSLEAPDGGVHCSGRSGPSMNGCVRNSFEARQSHSLNYAVVRDGKTVSRAR